MIINFSLFEQVREREVSILLKTKDGETNQCGGLENRQDPRGNPE